MAKVKRKIKKKLNNVKSIIATIAVILVIIFVLACYFYPPLYAFVLGLFNQDDQTEFKVEGDTTYITSGIMPDLKVHFVDVGQGDCIIIELPDGKNVIIDAGEKHYDDLDAYIKQNTNVKSFDYLIATHADSDHIGNIDLVLRDYEVKNIYRPYVKYTGDKYNFSDDFNQGSTNSVKSTTAYADFLNYVQNETYVENGETKSASWQFFTHESDFAGKISYNDTIYEYYFDFLTPRVVNLSDIKYKNANDYSPIIKFTYCGVDIMLTGDAEGGDEGDAEDDFVTYYSQLNVDVDVEILKVGHHGSRTSSTQAFLDLIKPEYAVIQCGEGNSYKHPHQSTLDRLFDMECSVYRNDIQGDIIITITNQGKFEFTTQRANTGNLFTGGDSVAA